VLPPQSTPRPKATKEAEEEEGGYYPTQTHPTGTYPIKELPELAVGWQLERRLVGPEPREVSLPDDVIELLLEPVLEDESLSPDELLIRADMVTRYFSITWANN